MYKVKSSDSDELSHCFFAVYELNFRFATEITVSLKNRNKNV